MYMLRASSILNYYSNTKSSFIFRWPITYSELVNHTQHHTIYTIYMYKIHIFFIAQQPIGSFTLFRLHDHT